MMITGKITTGPPYPPPISVGIYSPVAPNTVRFFYGSARVYPEPRLLIAGGGLRFFPAFWRMRLMSVACLCVSLINQEPSPPFSAILVCNHLQSSVESLFSYQLQLQFFGICPFQALEHLTCLRFVCLSLVLATYTQRHNNFHYRFCSSLAPIFSRHVPLVPSVMFRLHAVLRFQQSQCFLPNFSSKMCLDISQ